MTIVRDRTDYSTVFEYMGDIVNVGWYPYSTAISYRDYLDKTSTVKRIKPVDLFASGTGFGTYKFVLSNLGDGLWRRADGLRFRKGPASFFMGTAPAFFVGFESASQESQLLAQLDGKLRSKIKEQNVNLAQSFAEYQQVSGMFLRAGRDVVNTFRSLRNGRALSEFVRILQGKHGDPLSKRIANRWLEYQYGLKPLISDMYGLADQLTSNLTLGQYRFVGASVTANRIGFTSGQYDNLHKWSCRTTQEMKVKGIARYKVSASGIKPLAQIGVTNPVALAWELIPYSFVVDWLFNIGNFLNSLDALVGVTDLVVQRGARLTAVSMKSGIGSLRIDEERKIRYAVSSSLSLPPIVLEPVTSFIPVLNGLALIRQLH